MDDFDPANTTFLGMNSPLQHTLSPNMLAPTDVPLYYESDASYSYDNGSQYTPSYQALTPSLKRYSSNLDDLYSDHHSQHEQQTSHEQTAEDAAVDRDHRLLGFGPPEVLCGVLDSSYQPALLNTAAQLHGMFFLAESTWPSGQNNAAPLTELTCYRRNLFQVTGSVTLSRRLRYVITGQGTRSMITSQELVISATESVEGNAVKLISVPWKTSTTSAPVLSEDKSEREPATVPLELNDTQEIDDEHNNIPFAWKRLQFRIATANNGRRKELQQHFVIHLRVIATLEDGSKVPLSEIRSGAIIVRGRSPRNFQSRNDLPIGTSTGGGRRSIHTHHENNSSTSLSASGQLMRTPSGDTVSIKLEPPPRSSHLSVSSSSSMPMQSPYEPSLDGSTVLPELYDWRMPRLGYDSVESLELSNTIPVGPLDDFPAMDDMMYGQQSSPDLSRKAMLNLQHQQQLSPGYPQHMRHHSHQGLPAPQRQQSFPSIHQRQQSIPNSTSSKLDRIRNVSLTPLNVTKPMLDIQPMILSAPLRSSNAAGTFDHEEQDPHLSRRKFARLSVTPSTTASYLSPDSASIMTNLATRPASSASSLNQNQRTIPDFGTTSHHHVSNSSNQGVGLADFSSHRHGFANPLDFENWNVPTVGDPSISPSISSSAESATANAHWNGINPNFMSFTSSMRMGSSPFSNGAGGISTLVEGGKRFSPVEGISI